VKTELEAIYYTQFFAVSIACLLKREPCCNVL